jgi:hypothetical protein
LKEILGESEAEA